MRLSEESEAEWYHGHIRPCNRGRFFCFENTRSQSRRLEKIQWREDNETASEVDDMEKEVGSVNGSRRTDLDSVWW